MSASNASAHVAIIAPNWLGDAVMCLPAIRALRNAQPSWRLTVLARRGVAPVFEAANLELDLGLLPEPMSLRIPRLPEKRPDVCLVFPNSFYSALLAWRTRARRRIGYRRNGRGWLLTDAVALAPPGTLPAHESFFYLELLRRAGLIPALPPELPIELRVAPDAVAGWRSHLGTRLIAMHAGATYGTAKCWPPDRFAQLARRLAGAGQRVVLVGAPGERGLAESIRNQAGGGPRIDNLAGQTTLGELLALLAAADLLVANDSGPMHLAAAVGTPVVALFGSTNEKETYPLAQPGRLQILKVEGIECSPCKLRRCPIDHRCMTRLEVEAVIAAAGGVPARRQ